MQKSSLSIGLVHLLVTRENYCKTPNTLKMQGVFTPSVKILGGGKIKLTGRVVD